MYPLAVGRRFTQMNEYFLVVNSKRCSFLSDRKRRVVHNGTVCNWMMARKGTSQGNVSGPCLFNLFLGDVETDSNLDDTIPLY